MNNTNQPNTRPIIGQALTTLHLGATKKKNLVVNYLLLNMANVMLASVAPDDKFTREVQETADRTKRRLLASHTKEELEPIKIMAESAVSMARTLANAESIDGLNLARHYMDELTAGRVMIMEEDLPIDTAALTNPSANPETLL